MGNTLVKPRWLDVNDMASAIPGATQFRGPAWPFHLTFLLGVRHACPP
jgi:hypothetical protein